MVPPSKTPTKRNRKSAEQMQFAFDPTAKTGTRPIPPEPSMTAKPSTRKKNRTTRARSIAKAAAPRATKTGATPSRTAKTPTVPRKKKHIYATADSMSKAQREISVSEFFAKNRHLLGFDNKRKALLTTVKEAVDNSLDACEEAGILPDVFVRISQSDADRYRVTIRDNGPGIVKHQIPNIFGKLLYGSKFHRLKMSRGQQGIGISAAGMYGLLTTGKSIRITSRTSSRSEAHYYEVQINTKTNAPQIVKEKTVAVDWAHGTEVSIELVATYQKGRASVDDYIELTAIANPHASFEYVDPAGQLSAYPRGTDVLPAPTTAIKPHPYGIELGVLIKMLKETRGKSLAQFLHAEFSRVSAAGASAICKRAGLSPRGRPTRIGTHEAETLYKAMQEAPIRPPATNCLSPIGPEQILAGLLKGIRAEFFTAGTRSPAVYRGNPFQIEVGLAFGGQLGPDPSQEEENGNNNEAKVRRGKVVKQTRAPTGAKLMRFANRVPLLFQASGCCIQKSVIDIDWRRYGLSQSSGSLPQGPLAILVHLASVWVPFTSEGKEAIADYDEIRKEVRLGVQECARKLQTYLNRRKRQKYQADRRSIFGRYIGEVVNACSSIARVNKEKLAADLTVVAKRMTARADEELGMDGKVKKTGKKAALPGSEYGENTIVVEPDEAPAGPLFKG